MTDYTLGRIDFNERVTRRNDEIIVPIEELKRLRQDEWVLDRIADELDGRDPATAILQVLELVKRTSRVVRTYNREASAEASNYFDTMLRMTPPQRTGEEPV